MRGAGGKRPRGATVPSEQQIQSQSQGGTASTVPWAGRVPKPAMDADSLVDYGSGFLRKSCDSCVSSKRRCDGLDPCTRCQRRKKPCHYTERKKCGPRSGQKTSKGTRKARLSPSPSSSPGLKSTAPHANEQQAQHQYDSISRVPGADTGRRSMAKDSLEWQYVGVPLGSAPSMHTHPALSADETSGDTTSVDCTDVSDAPSLRHLSRDGSGSSWWSLEEQQASMSAGMGLGMGVPQPNHANNNRQGHGHGQQHGSTRPVHHMSAPTATGMHPSPMQAHAAMQAAAWNASQSGRKFSSAVAGVSGTHTPPQYPHQNLHQEVRASHSGGMTDWSSGSGSQGRNSSGPSSSAGSTTTMNSVQSGLDSSEASEDEGSSEVGFGQAEEEVAAMLVRLGQARIYFSDSDGPSPRSHHDDATAEAVQNARAAAHQQRDWENGRGWSDGRN